MKKFVISILMLAPLAVFAADFGIVEPEWKDFAPSAFVDVKAPKGILGKMNVSATYWYNRREAFQNGLEECRAFDDENEQFKCYEKLKVKQYRENSDYNARLEAKDVGMRGYPEVSGTGSMLPLGNCIDTFTKFQPNEFK